MDIEDEAVKTQRAIQSVEVGGRLLLALGAHPEAMTLKDLAAARDELARHGCTRAVGRPIPGVNAFSSPVFDHDGVPVLVLTLLGHQDDVPAAWSSPMASAVKRAAAEVSTRLGWRG